MRQRAARILLWTLAAQLLWFPVLLSLPVMAQVKSTRVLTQGNIPCAYAQNPAVAVFPLRPSRMGYGLMASSGTVLVGYGTGSVILSTANAVTMTTGTYIFDGFPSVTVLDVWCGSVVSGSSTPLTVVEFAQ